MLLKDVEFYIENYKNIFKYTRNAVYLDILKLKNVYTNFVFLYVLSPYACNVHGCQKKVLEFLKLDS